MDGNHIGDVIDRSGCILPQWLMNVETQAVIFAGLCSVGAWVILQMIFQVLFSVLWPFILVISVLLIVPSWRATLTKEYFPKQVRAIKRLTRRLYNYNFPSRRG